MQNGAVSHFNIIEEMIAKRILRGLAKLAYLSDAEAGMGQMCATFTPLRASLLPLMPNTSAPATKHRTGCNLPESCILM